MMKKTFAMLIMALMAAITLSSLNAEARKFRVMTFNIRLLNDGDGKNNWENRAAPVKKFIEKSQADVFGLQEATPPQMKFLSDTLKNYGYVGVGRDDGKNKGEYSPVFYRKDRYTLVKSGWFWLSETPDAPTLGWDAACKRICSWALLQDKKTGKSFVFANTHLDHIGEQARANGALLIKEKLGRISNDIPILITGDFNVNSESSAYSTMLTRLFPLGDTYMMAKKSVGPAYSFHGFGNVEMEQREKLDFIFATPTLKVLKHTIVDGTLGNGLYLSDHHPCIADFDANSLFKK